MAITTIVLSGLLSRSIYIISFYIILFSSWEFGELDSGLVDGGARPRKKSARLEKWRNCWPNAQTQNSGWAHLLSELTNLKFFYELLYNMDD